MGDGNQTLPAERSVMLITLSGTERPGVTFALFEACSRFPIQVRDIDQIVMRDQLILATSLELPTSEVPAVRQSLDRLAANLNMAASIVVRAADDPQNSVRRGEGFRITMMAKELSPAAVAEIAREIAEGGANIDRIRPIARYPVTAVAFEGHGVSADSLRRPLANISSSLAVDIAVQDVFLETRGHHLVVMDVDSTFIQDEVIDLLAEEAGCSDEVAALTTRAMAGEIDFSESLHRRVTLLAGLSDDVFARVRARVRLTPGARTLCRTLNRLGYRIVLVSGGFSQVIGPIAQQLGVSEFRSNTLEVQEGVLTGRLVGEIVDPQGKRKILEEVAIRYGVPRERTIAIGDGANDLEMLAAAGMGIAFNAKPITRQVADTSVSVPYLDSVLFLMGITRDEVEFADARDPGHSRAGAEVSSPVNQ